MNQPADPNSSGCQPKSLSSNESPDFITSDTDPTATPPALGWQFLDVLDIFPPMS